MDGWTNGILISGSLSVLSESIKNDNTSKELPDKSIEDCTTDDKEEMLLFTGN